MTALGAWRRWAASALATSGLEAGGAEAASVLDALAEAAAGVREGWPRTIPGAEAETGPAASASVPTGSASPTTGGASPTTAGASPTTVGVPPTTDGASPTTAGASPARLAAGGSVRTGSIAELRHALRTRALSAEALLETTLARVEAENPRLNAFITVTADLARELARRADDELARGIDRGPLHGLPVSLKDLIDVAGEPTTAASRVLADHRAVCHAPVVDRLIEAGAVVIGKTNLHEFAFGTTCEDSAFGPARHPLDPARSPGGSSGGSAAAVFTGLGVASIGTDTGGSIRIPSAACGIVGLKPTWGEVPAEGVVPLARSLDHVGPMAGSVADVEAVFSAIAGPAPPAPAPRPAEGGAPGSPDCARPTQGGGLGARDVGHAAGLRLARLAGYFEEVLDPVVRSAHEAALGAAAMAGARIETRAVEGASLTPAVYLLTVFAEAAAVHGAWLDGHAGAYSPAVRLRLEVARLGLAEDYVRAQELRGRLVMAVDAALAGVDALVLPTLPILAPLLGARTVEIGGREHPIRAMTLRLTQLFDLTGHPAISLPLWPAGSVLPTGLQLVGRRGDTRGLLATARRLESVLGSGLR